MDSVMDFLLKEMPALVLGVVSWLVAISILIVLFVSTFLVLFKVSLLIIAFVIEKVYGEETKKEWLD